MEQHYSKKQLEELYNCQIFKDAGFDDNHQFWTAHGEPLDKQLDGSELFIYADGWTLDELHENIREEIYGTCLTFAKG